MSKRHRILCADPHRNLCASLVSRMNEELSVRAQSAISANDIIERLLRGVQARDPFELLILDMPMPRGTGQPTEPEMGLEVLATVFNSEKWKFPLLASHTAVIFYVKSPKYQHAVRCLRGGAQDYLPKFGPSGQSNTIRLFERCRQLFEESVVEAEAAHWWFQRNQKRLALEHGGQFIAGVETERARHAVLRGPVLDGVVIIVGKSYGDVQQQILCNKMLRWHHPPIFNIPSREDFQYE